MDLEAEYGLKLEQIRTTIKNIKSSPNELVKKVLAEETTFEEECRRLETCTKEEFYHRRDELIEALNHYDFNKTINEDEKTN